MMSVKIKPMIGEFEVPGIQRIGSTEKRSLVSVAVPGVRGDYLQDMGSSPIGIVIEGSLADDEGREEFLADIREKFDAGDPVDFVADIVTATEVSQVIVSRLSIDEVAGSTDPFRYCMVLVQYIEPPESGSDLGFGSLDELGLDLELEAGDLFDILELPDLLGSIPDISNPLPPVTGVLDDLVAVTEGLADTLLPLSDLFS